MIRKKIDATMPGIIFAAALTFSVLSGFNSENVYASEAPAAQMEAAGQARLDAVSQEIQARMAEAAAIQADVDARKAAEQKKKEEALEQARQEEIERQEHVEEMKKQAQEEEQKRIEMVEKAKQEQAEKAREEIENSKKAMEMKQQEYASAEAAAEPEQAVPEAAEEPELSPAAKKPEEIKTVEAKAAEAKAAEAKAAQEALQAAQAAEEKAAEEKAAEEKAVQEKIAQEKAAQAAAQAAQAAQEKAAQAAAQAAVQAAAQASVPAASSADREILCRIVEAEASGDSLDGKCAVAGVVLNRVESPIFPNTVWGVVSQPGQFGPVRNGRYNSVKVSESTRRAVDMALAGVDNSGGALYFQNTRSASWAGKSFTGRVGHHSFFR